MKTPKHQMTRPEKVSTTKTVMFHRRGDVCEKQKCRAHHHTKEVPLNDNEAPLVQMRSLNALNGAQWAAYQNYDMSSAGIGDLRFMAFGPQCTYKTDADLPERMPDTQHGIGWRYLHVGYVDLKTGDIKTDI